MSRSVLVTIVSLAFSAFLVGCGQDEGKSAVQQMQEEPTAAGTMIKADCETSFGIMRDTGAPEAAMGAEPCGPAETGFSTGQVEFSSGDSEFSSGDGEFSSGDNP